MSNALLKLKYNYLLSDRDDYCLRDSFRYSYSYSCVWKHLINGGLSVLDLRYGEHEFMVGGNFYLEGLGVAINGLCEWRRSGYSVRTGLGLARILDFI